jgi:hypothetical protein
MTLTVRLDESLAIALSQHCAAHGITKSQAVQHSLAAYLLRASATESAPARDQLSHNLKAFEAAGLLAAGDLGAASADKRRVRERVTGKPLQPSKALGGA